MKSSGATWVTLPDSAASGAAPAFTVRGDRATIARFRPLARRHVMPGRRPQVSQCATTERRRGAFAGANDTDTNCPESHREDDD